MQFKKNVIKQTEIKEQQNKSHALSFIRSLRMKDQKHMNHKTASRTETENPNPLLLLVSSPLLRNIADPIMCSESLLLAVFCVYVIRQIRIYRLMNQKL